MIAAAQQALDRWGSGYQCASSAAPLRFTRSLNAVSRTFSTEDAILYSSCFDANGGLFETLLGPRMPSSPTS